MLEHNIKKCTDMLADLDKELAELNKRDPQCKDSRTFSPDVMESVGRALRQK